MNEIAKVFSYSHGVEERRRELYQIGEELKKEFVGIDVVIDTIIKLMEPWRIMPEAQNRPVIINLWGMTGTGKTSLVRRLSSLLNSPFVQVDLGEFGENRNFSTDFYEKYDDMSEKESMILLDEIQNCKTIESNRELDRPALRGLWSLLSDGIIVPDQRISKEYYEEDIQEKIEKFIRLHGETTLSNNKKIKLSDNVKKIIKSRDLAVFDPDNEIDLENDEEENDGSGEENDGQKNVPWHISEWTICSVLRLCGNKIPYNKNQIKSMLKTDFLKTATTMLEELGKLELQPQLNYKKSIIFIAGNLDEIYLMSKNANPDITPDMLHEKSKKITVPDVKQALLRRFRPEQVARFGNNHVIYPAFNEQNFRDIINLDLKRIHKHTTEQYDVNLIFDKSVENLIYSEGVFPTQGARPVLSTISTLVESSIPSCLKEIITQYEKTPLYAPINIKMSLDGKTSLATFEMIDNDTMLNQEKIFLSIETLRKPIYDDEHVVIAVHEAGHSVCQMMEFGELPTKICAFSPNVNSEGYMERKAKDYVTKEMVESMIVVALGGWAAEKLIFGSEKICAGSYSDISLASGEAACCIQSWGFGELPIVIQRPSESDNSGIVYNENTDMQIKKIIEKCLQKAESHLQKNKKILLDISGELLNKPHLLEKDIENIIKKHGLTLNTPQKLTNIFEDAIKKQNIQWKSNI